MVLNIHYEIEINEQLSPHKKLTERENFIKFSVEGKIFAKSIEIYLGLLQPMVLILKIHLHISAIKSPFVTSMDLFPITYL